MQSLIFITALMLLTLRAAAMPILVRLDVDDPANRPADVGYKITATAGKDSVLFTVYVEQPAAEELRRAEVRCVSPTENRPKTGLTIDKSENGHKRITFRLRASHIADCGLLLHSTPLRSTDPKINFYAYRIRLDNVLTSASRSVPHD